jgi:cation diffusion facilitator family transporter
LVLNLSVALAKLAAGLATGALALLADGFHSLIDGLSNVVALWAQKIASQPPDADHPYGHRRFETLATLALGGLLLVTAWELSSAALGRLLAGGGGAEASPLNVGVLLVTLVINIGVTLYERAAGRRYASRLLVADAKHTTGDIFTSLSVLLSLGLVAMGLAWADGLFALLIVALIAFTGYGIIREAVAILVDSAPLSAESLTQTALSVAGVERVLSARSRGGAEAIHADVWVQIPPETTAEHSQNLRHALESALKQAYPTLTEAQINFAPPPHHTPPNYPLRVRALADPLGLSAHEVTVIPTEGGVALEMHVEIRPDLSLQAAHEHVSALEARLKDSPDVQAVTTHIEPAQGIGAPHTAGQNAHDLIQTALTLAQDCCPSAAWHDPTIRPLEGGGYALSLHAHMDGALSLQAAHDLAEATETYIRARLPLIQRLTIHTEPREAD